jgi:hypothetical protein
MADDEKVGLDLRHWQQLEPLDLATLKADEPIWLLLRGGEEIVFQVTFLPVQKLPQVGDLVKVEGLRFRVSEATDDGEGGHSLTLVPERD